MKTVCFCVFVILVGISCHAQQKNSVEDSIMNLHPSIYYHLNNDGDYFSDELVLLFPDSSFYFELSAPMMLGYTKGRYTCHGDSLYLTSCQLLDTLDILKVEEYRNPTTISSHFTIVVVDEENDVEMSRFIINGTDTVSSDSNWILRYDGEVKTIQVSVADMRRYSRYTVRSPHNNFLIMHVNSEEKLALALGQVCLLENRLFIMKEHSLFDTLTGRELNVQTTLPQGAELRPFRKCNDFFENQ